MKLFELFDRLDELNMSPSALQKALSDSNTKDVMIGFEAELIIPAERFEGEGSIDGEDRITSDTSREFLDDAMERFESFNSQADVEKAVMDAEEDILESMTEAFRNYVDSDDIYDMLVSNGMSHEEAEQEVEDEGSDYNDALNELESAWMSELESIRDFIHTAVGETWSDFADRTGLYNPMGAAFDDPEEDWQVNYDIQTIADDLAETLGVNVIVAEGYHSETKDDTSWYLEPDSSVSANSGDEQLAGKGVGIEFVSPPMQFREGIEKLKEFFRWANVRGAVANPSTGFHLGVSLPAEKARLIDPTKLMLFLGDEHILRKFGRHSNSFAESLVKRVEQELKSGRYESKELLKDMKEGLERITQQLFMKSGVFSEKYTSIHIKSRYVEFRSAGGVDYIDNLQKILDTVRRFTRSYIVATDPEAYKKEYAKKLYKLLDKSMDLGKTDVTPLMVSKYVAGYVTKTDVTQDRQLRQLQQKYPDYEIAKNSWGDIVFRKHTYIHREDGPAIYRKDGTKEWHIKGKRHRLDGPAVVAPEKEEYWENGKQHRMMGPAIEDTTDRENHFWYLRGVWLSFDEYCEKLKYDENTKKKLILHFYPNTGPRVTR